MPVSLLLGGLGIKLSPSQPETWFSIDKGLVVLTTFLRHGEESQLHSARRFQTQDLRRFLCLTQWPSIWEVKLYTVTPG